MQMRVIALAQDDYDAWVENQLQDARTPSDPEAAAGLELAPLWRGFLFLPFLVASYMLHASLLGAFASLALGLTGTLVALAIPTVLVYWFA